jgi:hypothetical protein
VWSIRLARSVQGMGRIITAFGVGMSFAATMLSGVEDLHTGGPWILTLIVFPTGMLTCLAFMLRDQRKEVLADDRQRDSESSSSGDRSPEEAS